jgi:uncharacterized protein YbjT (DUF2867 family)
MTSVVTGAFGYIGHSIARQLIHLGEDVRTVTTHIGRLNPFGRSLEVYSYDFDRPERLTRHLQGAQVLYNTYWIRFEHGGMTFEQAVRNTRTLFECAREAGISKIVHISVTGASEDSPLPYYAGKAGQEQALKDAGVPYAILRPTLVFGQGDILVNNIAWLMRHFPFFPIFGSGAYRMQPVFVDDLGAIAIEASKRPTSATDDVIGPEDFTFRRFAEVIASIVRPGLPLVHVPPWLGISAGRMIGSVVRDVILTRDELRGLMDEMLTSDAPPGGTTRFSEWAANNKDVLGSRYASELARHFTPTGGS